MIEFDTFGKYQQTVVGPKDWNIVWDLLHDGDEDVREAAVDAFVRIAQPEDWEKTIEMQYDEDFDVQRSF